MMKRVRAEERQLQKVLVDIAGMPKDEFEALIIANGSSDEMCIRDSYCGVIYGNRR